MRRRITEAIVGVTALILLALGIPLALAVHQSILNSEVVELQGVAARTLAEVAVPLDPVQLAGIRTESDAPPPFSVYDAGGHLIFGNGPAEPDRAVRLALRGTQSSFTDREIVVATPIIDDSAGGEKVIGALRAVESLDDVDHRSWVGWGVMVASAAAALGLAWLIARRVARRLSRPVVDLAAAASALGTGGSGGTSGAGRVVVPTAPTGVAEIDTLATALADSSVRISEAMERERRFSADVSHQLRTPMTGLRLVLEAARDHPDPAAIDRALQEVARIESTTDHLLALARGAIPAGSGAQLDTAAASAVRRWTDRPLATGRVVTLVATDPVRASAAPASVDQILDILLENALLHGAGTVSVTQRRLAGGGAISVTDEGEGVAVEDAERIFARGEGRRTGIGLALARSLAEAEDGRLLWSQIYPLQTATLT